MLAEGGKQMSLVVYISHTGARLEADPVLFDSLDAFRHWISRATAIPPQNQILLTSKARQVKLQALLTEKEIFLYDRSLFTPSRQQPAESPIPPAPVPAPYAPSEPPSTLSDRSDIKAWHNLFRVRRDWAAGLLATCKTMCGAAEKAVVEKHVVARSILVATTNHESRIRTAEQQLSEAKAWVADVQKECEDNSRSVEGDLARLKSIPAREDFLPLMAPADRSARSRKTAGKDVTMASFVDADAVRKAATISRSVAERLGRHGSELTARIERTVSDFNELRTAVEQARGSSSEDAAAEPSKLLHEIEMVASKVASDHDHVLGLGRESIAQVSKMALLHTRNFLPTMHEYAVEMSDLVRRAIREKNSAVDLALAHIQSIASMESVLSALKSELDAFEMPPEGMDSFELLGAVSRLPYVYGSLLLEVVRRREWIDKMKKDASALAEELAGYREEEDRRRKRWAKSIGDAVNLDALDGVLPGVEISVHGEERSLPNVSRRSFEDYVAVLQAMDGMRETAEPLAQALRDLDRPTKQQVKRAKNFKMGSVHEASFGRGSLLLRGEDEMKVLRDANAKLEEQLKSSRSRVRKLEDLLHRSSQLGRLSIGSGFPSQSSQSPEPSTPTPDPLSIPSPRPQEELSRRSSISSRRFSSHQPADERMLTQRVLKLEAELLAEREGRARLEREQSARESADAELRRRLAEINSTKKDLMENMDAQQKEFADERRSLEAELLRYKNRIDEVEDELDRILGSRDNERTGTEDKMRSLVAELDHVRKEAAEELDRTEKRAAALEADLRKRDGVDIERRAMMVAAYSALSPEGDAPADVGELLDDIERLARRSTEHVEQLGEAVAAAKAENEAMRSAREGLERDAASKMEILEDKVVRAHDELATARAGCASLSVELEGERKHLQDLRRKFADGETGSEALRQRVAEEEAKVGSLSADLATAKSHVNSLDVELSLLQKRYAALQTRTNADKLIYQERSVRARELTQRLYSQIDRLHHLLESLGFIVSHEDGSMVIQRLSRATASTMLDKSAAHMNRSVSAPPPSKKPFEESELKLLDWMEQDSPEAEAVTYAEYLKTLDRFDLTSFSEAVTKRVRDMEHTARKWQKEARAYRDKSHRFQSEAHEKIAIRSFKEGDLALFLPTRNQATRPWAAFNIGAPHYFLRETEAHRLHNKEWLVARISKVEERVVDLSKAMANVRPSSDGRSIAESDGGASFEDDNPFELSDGLRWYLLDAVEERGGAPSTPGLGKSTVASVHVDAKGSIRAKKTTSGNDATKTLHKSLESRRSSTNSKKSIPATANIANKPSPSETLAEAAVARLRSGSQASVAKPGGLGIEGAAPAPGGGESADQGGRASNGMSPTPDSPAVSPSKLVLNGPSSPSKLRPKSRGGIWDSLWQLDISLESGKRKK